MNSIRSQLRKLAILTTALLPAYLAPAATVVWSGGGATQNWSLGGAGGNWTGSPAPSATDDVKFYDPGADPSQGIVNNIVDATRTVKSLQYGNTNSFHTTQISTGITLTNLGSLTVGTETDSATNQVVYTTITGAGGTLVVSNAGASLVVRQTSATAAAHLSTLDLSGLDTFSGNFGPLLVGAGNSGLFKRAQGTLMLAATNTISLTGADVQLMVGDNPGNNNGNSSVSLLYLGAQNSINVNSIRVGGAKQRGTMSFGASWSAPTLVLRGTNGTVRIATIALADNTAASTSPSTGVMDLSGGVVDALADAVYVGRGQPSGTSAGASTGTLTLGGGIFDVNTLEIGYQNSTTAPGVVTGTVNVNSNPTLGTNATLVVNGTLRLARFTSGTASVGTLNIYGGIVRANVITNGGGTTAITMSGGTLIVTNAGSSVGTVAAPIGTLTMGDSHLVLAVTANATNVVVASLATLSSTNNTIDIAALPIITSYPAQYPLIASSSAPSFDFLLGTLPAASPAYVGYISNNVDQSTIDLVITGGPVTSRALVWNGTPSGNWDTSIANWLVAGSPTAYNPIDAVLFDDTAAGTTTVNLTTMLSPFTLTVNNPTRNYTFAGAGSLGGSPGLNKQGAGALIIGNSGSNGFGGGITINGGKIQISGSDNRLPANATVTLADDATAELDLNNLNQMVGSLAGGGPAGGNVTLGSGTLSFDGGAGTYSGVISGSGSVVKNGSGTQVLGGANLYSGGTVVSAGTLAVANATGSGVGPGSVTVATNSTCAFGNGGPGGSVAAGFITNNGTVAFNRSDDFTLANVIQGNGAVTKNNTNTVLIPISNTYTGNTTISAGVLRISNAGALGDTTGQTSIQNDPTARLELLGGLTLAEPLLVAQKQGAAGTAPCILNVSDTNTLAGRLNLTSGGSFWTFEAASGELVVAGAATNITTTAATRMVWLRGAGAGVWSSGIADGGFAGAFTGLRKDDAGAWTLSGNNTYTGPTVVSNGTLVVNGTITAASTNSVTVNGGTLSGTGTIKAAVVIGADGTLAPGSSIGTLTISNTLVLNGTTVMEVAHSDADQVAGLTSVTYGGTLRVVVAGPLKGEEVFKLFEAGSYSSDFAFYDMPVFDPPLYWDTSLLLSNGILRVGGVPQIGSVTLSGGNLVMGGTGGPINGTYYVLASTNAALPLASWTRMGASQFDSAGNFNSTNAVNVGLPRQFFMLQVQ